MAEHSDLVVGPARDLSGLVRDDDPEILHPKEFVIHVDPDPADGDGSQQGESS